MQTRPFGRLGWPVSAIGMGTWSMGGMWGPVDDREAVRALHRALALGVTFIDTAAVYGNGHAEELLAAALADRSEPVRIATKIPPRNGAWPAAPGTPAREAFSARWILAQTEASLRRLRRETVDLQQLHVWADSWLAERDVWLPAIERLKRAGKIRAFGVSLNDHEPDSGLALVASGVVDSVQVIYNVFDQAPADRLFPACRAHGVAVIARVPFDEGSLTGQLTADTRFAGDDWRRDYFTPPRLRETVARVARLAFLTADGARTLPQAALQFCLADPAVSTVIPGMRTIAHVEHNCAAEALPPLAGGQLAEARRHAWARNFYPFGADD